MASTSVGSVFLDFRAGVASFNNDLSKIKKALDNTAKDMEKAGKNLSTAFTLPIIAMSAGVLKAANNFQHAQKIIVAGTGATGKVLQGLKQDFADIARTVPNSLDETAKALSDVYTMTGQSGESGKELAKTFLNLSEVTGTDLNENLKNGLKLFKAWEVSQEDQIPVLDMMARGAARANMSVTEFMGSIEGIDKELKPFGVSLEQATTWMSAFGQTGADQEVVAAGLKKAIQALVSEGVTDLPAAFEQSVQAIKNATSYTDAMSMSMNLFGKKAAPEMLDAIRDGTFGLKGFSNEVVNGSNTIKGMTESNRTFFDQIKVMGNNLNISLGNVGLILTESLTRLQPAIEGAITKIAQLVEWFSKLSPEIQTNTFLVIGFTAVLGPLLIQVSKLLSFGGQLVGWFRSFLTMLAGTTKELGLLQKVWNFLTSGFNGIIGIGSRVISVFSQIVGWFTSGSAIASVLGVAISAVSGVFIGLSGAAYLAGGDIKLFLSGFVELFHDTVNVLTGAWNTFTTNFSAGWDIVTQRFSDGLNIIIQGADTWLQKWGVDVPGTWEVTVQALTSVWDTFNTWFGEKIDSMIAVWDGWLASFRRGIGTIAELLGNDAWAKWARDSQAAADGTLDGFQSISPELVKIQTESKKTGEAIAEGFTGLEPEMKKVQSTLEDGKMSVGNFQKELNKPTTEGNKNLGVVNDLLQGTGDKAKKAGEELKKLKETLNQKIRNADLDFLKENLEGAIKHGGTFETIESLRNQITQNIRAGLIDGFDGKQTPEVMQNIDTLAKIEGDEINKQISEGAQKGLEDGLLKVIDVGAAFDNVGDALGEAIFEGLETGFSLDTLQGLLDGLKETVFDAIKGAITSSISNGLKGAFSSTLSNSLGSLGGTATNALGGAVTGGTGTAGTAGVQLGGATAAGLLGGIYAAFGMYIAQTNWDRLGKTFGGANNASNEKMWTDVVTAWIDAVFPGIGTAINVALGYIGIGSGGKFSKEELALKGIDKWIEEILKKNKEENGGFGLGIDNIRTGDYFGDFRNNDWATDYWTQFEEGGASAFNALGEGLKQISGITEDVGGQLAYILANNLNGNIDKARMLLLEMGIGAKELEEAFLQIGLSGEESWHTVETYFQQINALTGEGLIAVGDVDGAFAGLRDSAGRGQQALISLQNIAIEGTEKGITSLEELKESMIASGQYSEADITAFFTALSQRGITSLEELKGASQRTLGGIVADMETLGFTWTKIDDNAKGFDQTLGGIQQKLDKIQSEPVNVTIKLNYEENNKPENLDLDIVPNANGNIFSNGEITKFAKGGIFNSPTLFGFGRKMGMLGEAGPEAILPLTRTNGKLGVETSGVGGTSLVINIDATGAESGVEHKIMNVISTMRDSIIQDAIEIVAYQSQRN